ncbi:MAG TPA: MaoC family dehydratase [Conexibacter sp.]|jgi:acyl dehydratase
MTAAPRALTIDELPDLVGTTLGESAWTTVAQERIDRFAQATGDHQWIHVDAERAAAGPFGATIAHGYLTLSMCAGFLDEVVTIDDARMGINYGLDRVRFPAPVPVGSAVRGRVELHALERVDGGVQVVFRTTVELRDQPKPACVAETVARYYR